MKSLVKYIAEVSSEFMRKAAKRQRQLLDDDKYLSGKTAAEYKKLLKRAEAFDNYADKIDAKKAEQNFLRQTNGTLIYNENNIQIKLYGDFDCDIDYKCYDRNAHDEETINKRETFTTGDIMEFCPSNEEIKDELGETYYLDEDEPVYNANIEYPEVRIYYNYITTPIVIIKGLVINDAHAECGPGGDSYYDRSFGSRDFYGGEIDWNNIEITDEYDNVYKILNILKKPLCNAIAHVINYPMGYEFVEEYDDIYHNLDFQKIGCDDLIDAILEE